MNDRASVGEATRAHVLGTVAELGYRPSAIAQGLRAQKSRIIGYNWHRVSADRWHPILNRFLYSMTEAAEAQGYHILTFTSGSSSKPWLPYEELMLTGQVDGFVLSDTDRNDECVRYLLNRGFPGGGYMLTDDAPHGILYRKIDREEHHHDPECYHASLHEM